MSFILDALKKSENERARQVGPVLLEARVARPRRGVPAWAVAVTVVLLANLVVLAVVLLRRPEPPAAPLPTPTTPTAQAPQPAAAPAQPPAPVPTPAPTPAPASVPPPVAPPPVVAAPGTVAQVPAPSSRVQVMPAPAAVNPADYEPARPPAPGGGSFDDVRLPSASDLRASGAQLPELRLALHVYDADPAARYVLLNSQRMREGDTLPDGLRLERVTPTGLVLEWRGRRFRLQPGE